MFVPAMRRIGDTIAWSQPPTFQIEHLDAIVDFDDQPHRQQHIRETHPRCAAISTSAGNQMMDSHDEIECEPGTRHDNRSPMIIRRNVVLPGRGLVGCNEMALARD